MKGLHHSFPVSGGGGVCLAFPLAKILLYLGPYLAVPVPDAGDSLHGTSDDCKYDDDDDD